MKKSLCIIAANARLHYVYYPHENGYKNGRLKGKRGARLFSAKVRVLGKRSPLTFCDL